MPSQPPPRPEVPLNGSGKAIHFELARECLRNSPRAYPAAAVILEAPPDGFARRHLLRPRLLVARDRYRLQASRGRAIAELALTVVAPAVGYSGGGPPAGMGARTHLAEEETASDRDRR